MGVEGIFGLLPSQNFLENTRAPKKSKTIQSFKLIQLGSILSTYMYPHYLQYPQRMFFGPIRKVYHIICTHKVYPHVLTMIQPLTPPQEIYSILFMPTLSWSRISHAPIL